MRSQGGIQDNACIELLASPVLVLQNIDSTEVGKEGQVSRNQTVLTESGTSEVIDTPGKPRRYVGYGML